MIFWVGVIKLRLSGQYIITFLFEYSDDDTAEGDIPAIMPPGTNARCPAIRFSFPRRAGGDGEKKKSSVRISLK